jgi:hypothetical protein
MVQDVSASRRELVVRVATLELLVADLIDLLWRVDAKGMEQLAGEAGHDLEIQLNRVTPPAVEARRERLHAVLQERHRKLQNRRGVRSDTSDRPDTSDRQILL